jgi:hypothetical protein
MIAGAATLLDIEMEKRFMDAGDDFIRIFPRTQLGGDNCIGARNLL